MSDVNNHPSQPQPSAQVVISIQKQEIDRLNDNRVYMMAVLEETQREAIGELKKRDDENARLLGVVSQLKGMLNDDVLEEAEKIIAGG